MVKKMDLGSEDFLTKPMKVMQDKNKIMQFYENKHNYYKNLGNKKSVWVTQDAASKNKQPAGMQLTSVKVKPTVKKSESDAKKKNEDILYQFSNVTQNFIPFMQKQKEEFKRQAALKRMEEEEKKFEDSTYLN